MFEGTRLKLATFAKQDCGSPCVRPRFGTLSLQRVWVCSSRTLWRRFTRLSVCPRCVTRGHPGGRSPRLFLLPHGSSCSAWVGFFARRVQSSRALVDPQEVCILSKHVVFH
ncbi:unnamed protein product, partial [Ectocarpus sp. 4 AP-2014]